MGYELRGRLEPLGTARELTTVTMRAKPGSSTHLSTGCYSLCVFLFAIETIGVVIFYWKGLPLFRQLMDDPTAYESRPEMQLWSLSAIVLVQAGYWARYRIDPPMSTFANVVIGHIVLFLSRMVFTLATAVFAFVFLLRRLAPQMQVFGYVLTLAGLFSMFLYMQELQGVGSALMQNKRIRGKQHRD
jgi:hypothetical protein